MSMYDVVFSDHNRQQRVGTLLAVLAWQQPNPKGAEDYVQPIFDLRLRDAWVEKQSDGPPVLAVYTRNGGGNREHLHEGDGECTACHGEEVTKHPAYLRDADDDFDSTYRTYWFAFPDDLPSHVREVLTEVAVEPKDMSQIWLAAIDQIAGGA